MSLLVTNIILIAVFCFAVFMKVKGIVLAIKSKNNDQLKVNLFFLSIIIVVGVVLFLLVR